MNTIGIIGAGAWGTALAQTWANAGHHVKIYARRAEVAGRINTAHTHDSLPGVTLDTRLIATPNYADIDACDIVVYAQPAQVMRAHLTAHPVKPGQTFVIAAKGIEVATGQLLPDIVTDICPGAIVAVLSGPNIALEIARGLPAASTLACTDQTRMVDLQKHLSTKTFRLYPTGDVRGVAVGGAIKNVIIMASGIVDGMGLGENARAAILTRGLAEMVRLTRALGGDPETLMGLSGVGDMALKSRNYRYGVALAQGQTQTHDTIEGIDTARAVVTLAARLGIEMPICAAVNACVNDGMSLSDAVDDLLQRPHRAHEKE